jgi:hypothetical protein
MLKVNYKIAWLMAHRINETMSDPNPAPLGAAASYQHYGEQHLQRYPDEFTFR